MSNQKWLSAKFVLFFQNHQICVFVRTRISLKIWGTQFFNFFSLKIVHFIVKLVTKCVKRSMTKTS